MMKITRLVGLSLYHTVQKSLTRIRVGEKPKSADFKVFKLKYSNIQTDYPIVVRVNGIEENPSNYIVDYKSGSINVSRTILTSSDVVEVDYKYCTVNLYDESANPLSNDFSYPAVAVYEIDREDTPKELGNAKKEMHPTWGIEVWSERGGERDDITDTIMELFEGSIEVVDYNIAFPVNEDGTKNDNFDEVSQTIGYMDCDSINYRKGGSLDIGDKPKFLTEILVDLTINT